MHGNIHDIAFISHSWARSVDTIKSGDIVLHRRAIVMPRHHIIIGNCSAMNDQAVSHRQHAC
ncbi:MAG: hypothetical protein JNN13_10415 [Planctomycetes bacterium]|nr:hypothetical protein [Planctomycetota bacterium]